jgi:hypothetical protein
MLYRKAVKPSKIDNEVEKPFMPRDPKYGYMVMYRPMLYKEVKKTFMSSDHRYGYILDQN